MSESGKVSLPTPERIQELKGRYEGLSPEDITFMTVGELTGLLAALEETQQQLDDIKQRTHSKIYTQSESIKTSREMIDDLFNQLTEARQQLVSKTLELTQAEQTIARQQLAMSRSLTNLTDALNFPFAESNDDTRCVKRMIDTAITILSEVGEGDDLP
jgi:uncharacterized phage infection (PIP) family protein YhgE